MRDILEQVQRWRQAGEPVALATVLQTWGSSPRQAGAKMAITAAGEFAGSVSGGCVEAAVIEVGQQVLQSSEPRYLHFGVADETAWEVGLACGGRLDVFVEPLDADQFDFLYQLLSGERTASSVTLVKAEPEQLGRKMIIDLDNPDHRAGSLSAEAALELAKSTLEPTLHELTLDQSAAEAFVDPIPPSPTLIMIGGVQISIALAELAKVMGFRTIIVDPRRAFATDARFPGVDRLLPVWPGEAFEQVPLNRSTAVVTLTHDPKIDEPALSLALPSQAFYVGALGSRRTQQRRRERLREAGLDETDLERLHGPVGIELGGDTPEDIALSIMAEIVAVKSRKDEH